MELDRRRVAIACLLVVAGVAIGSAAVIEMYHVGEGVHYNASDGPEVELGDNIEANAQQPFPDDNTVDLSPHGTVSSPGPTYARVTNIDGEQTQFSQLDVADHPMTIDVDGKNEIVVEGGASAIEFRDVGIDNGQTDLSVTTSTSTEVTVRDLPSDEYLRVVDGSGSTYEVVHTGNDGEVTLTFSTDTSVSFEDTDVTIEDPSPSDGSVINEQASTNVSVFVSHPTFEDGESVAVKFYDAADDSLIGQDNLASDGRAEVSWSSIETGANDWYVVVDDQQAVKRTSDTWTFDVPGDLEIRDEETQELIQGDNATVTVQFYQDGTAQTVTKSTTDGVVDLTDLPASEELIISMEADGYYDRRIVLRDVAQQQTGYLLNESTDAVQNDWTINDRTSDFPPSESRVLISKTIPTGDNTSEYQIITGDDLGGDGRVSTTLARGDRYRILVEGRDGQIRSLGSYQAERDGLVELEVGTISIEFPDDQGYVFSAKTEETDNESTTGVRVIYKDQANNTDRLEYTIHEIGNESAVVHGPVEVYEPSEYSEVVELADNTSYAVTWEAERGDETISGTTPVGGVGPLNLPVSATFLSVFGLSGIIMVSGLFGGALSRTGSVVIVVIAWAMTMIGVLSIPYPFLAGAGIVAMLFKIGDGGVRV
jgi:hypothetical protein